MKGWHVGRHWPATYRRRSSSTLEQECPCPVEPCGLIDFEKVDPACPQHSIAAGQAIRSSHPAEDCPGAPES